MMTLRTAPDGTDGKIPTVPGWMKEGPAKGVTVADVLEILGGQILDPDDPKVLEAPTYADLLSIEAERARWSWDGETWRQVIAPKPKPKRGKAPSMVQIEGW
jgi:hypothetical protein